MIALASWLHGVAPSDWWVPLAQTNESGNFPCANHACGCLSAAQCWDHCCCYSVGERLAWAAARGIAPPAGLPARATLQRGGSCCGSHADETQAAHAEVRSISLVEKVAEPPNRAPAISPARCHGIFHTLAGGVLAPTPVAELGTILVRSPPEALLLTPRAACASRALLPASPPPRA